jgi:hypothetical protein
MNCILYASTEPSWRFVFTQNEIICSLSQAPGRVKQTCIDNQLELVIISNLGESHQEQNFEPEKVT